MASNIIQVKRTAVTGRQPNTTNSSNSTYIAAGEFALNMTDDILYSSDGATLITIGSNLVNQNVTGILTANQISANSSLPTSAGQVLTANATFGMYWAAPTGGLSSIAGAGNVAYDSSRLNNIAAANYVQNTDSRILSGNLNFTASNVSFATINVGSASFIANTTRVTLVNIPLFANSSNGSQGDVLYSNGSTGSPYWAAPTGGSGGTVDTTNTFAWTNTHTFSNVVTFNGDVVFSSTFDALYANSALPTSAGQVLTANATGGVYWSTVTGGGGGSGTVTVSNTFAWTNLHSFSNTVTFNGGIISTNTITANSVVGTGGYVLTSGGSGANVFWAPGATFNNGASIAVSNVAFNNTSAAVAYSFINAVSGSLDTVFV